jgi:large subunit ribosomal protein L15
MRLDDIAPAKGAKKNRKRVGCGHGSGHGKTSCRGHKGQKARSGSSIPAWFEGGQMPLQRRIPKRGFHNPFRVAYQVVNVKDLSRFPAGANVNVESLLEAGLIKKRIVPVKLLGEGGIDRPLKIEVHACGKKAKELVEKAGGEVRIIGA